MEEKDKVDIKSLIAKSRQDASLIMSLVSDTLVFPALKYGSCIYEDLAKARVCLFMLENEKDATLLNLDFDIYSDPSRKVENEMESMSMQDRVAALCAQIKYVKDNVSEIVDETASEHAKAALGYVNDAFYSANVAHSYFINKY